MKLLPTSEQLENSVKVEYKLITNRRKVIKELETLVKYIDFRRIKEQIIIDIIEPLEITPTVTVYRKPKSNNLNEIRGIPFLYKIAYIWDKSACGSKLIIEDDGKVVKAKNDCDFYQNVRAKVALEGKGIFEWDIVIEKTCNRAWVGVCADNFSSTSTQPSGWILCSSGYTYASETCYCPSFGDGARITIHLDMNNASCAFTVNGIRYSKVLQWDNFPSRLYPVVALRYPGRIRINAC